MNQYWVIALVVSYVVSIFGGYEAGTWRAAAAQDKIDKTQIVAEHADSVRGNNDAASYEIIHAAVEAKLNALIPKVEVTHAKPTIAHCHVPADVMQSISAAVKSRTAG